MIHKYTPHMDTVLVWLEDQETREEATEVMFALDEEDAARQFVDLDSDRRADGVYEREQTLIVEKQGKRTRVTLHTEWEPVTYVTNVEKLD